MKKGFVLLATPIKFLTPEIWHTVEFPVQTETGHFSADLPDSAWLV